MELRTESNLCEPRRRSALPSPWGRWHGTALLSRTVTDEGSPLKAGFTAVRTLANLRLAAEPPRLPLRRELARPKDTRARLRER